MNFIDLKPSRNNFGFSIEVLEKVFLSKLKKPFSTKSIFKVLSGAKGFGKTYLICLLAWFWTCNFEDYNVLLAKYTFASAKEIYYSMMTKVTNDLSFYGVEINKFLSSKEIKSFNSENRCEWVFDNGRMIRVIGFDNPSKWEGVPAAIGEWGMFAIDEVIPLKDKIINDEDYIYQLFNIISQIVRGQNLITSFEEFDELKSKEWQLYKQHLIIFGFNNHNTDHPIYQLFVEAIVPLTKEIKEELASNAVSVEDDPNFLNVGATVVRGTMLINEKNLNNKLKELGEGIKEKYPEIYSTLFMGGEHEMSIDRYSYRKDLITNAQFFDPKNFFWDKNKRFWFNEIRIGCDYADGGELGDDAVVILLGFEIDKNMVVKGVYVLNELSISTRKFKNMTLKVKQIASTINEWSQIYEVSPNQIALDKDLKFKIGHDSRTIKDFLIEILANDFELNKEMLEKNFSVFKATGSQGWPIFARHYTWKRLLSEKKLWFSKNLNVIKKINGNDVEIKPHGYLFDELYKAVNHPDKNIRDERPKKNKLDAINAAEHALSFFRYSLFNS